MPYKFPGTKDAFTAAIAAARVARAEERVAIERRASDEFLACVERERRQKSEECQHRRDVAGLTFEI